MCMKHLHLNLHTLFVSSVDKCTWPEAQQPSLPQSCAVSRTGKLGSVFYQKNGKGTWQQSQCKSAGVVMAVKVQIANA